MVEIPAIKCNDMRVSERVAVCRWNIFYMDLKKQVTSKAVIKPALTLELHLNIIKLPKSCVRLATYYCFIAMAETMNLLPGCSAVCNHSTGSFD